MSLTLNMFSFTTNSRSAAFLHPTNEDFHSSPATVLLLAVNYFKTNRIDSNLSLLVE